MTSAQPDWGGYLAQFHAQRSGITEALLSCATDTAGRTPYGWLAAAVPTRGSVLDLACGSAPTGDVLPAAQCVGLDLSCAELRLAAARGLSVAQADAARLPVADAGVDAVVWPDGAAAAAAGASLGRGTPGPATRRHVRRHGAW